MTRNINTWPYSGEDGMTDNFHKKNNRWTETIESVYWDQLGCVPPIRQEQNCFLVGECYDHTEDGKCFAAFMKIAGRYFGKIIPLKKWNPQQMRDEIFLQCNS